MKGFICVIALALAVVCEGRVLSNEVESARIGSGDELLSSIINECFGAPSATECLKVKVLTYLDNVLGYSEQSARAFSSDNIDKVIFDRVGKILNKNEFRMKLPETVFQGAEVSYRADRGMDVDFSDDDETTDAGTTEARGLLKKKLLLPVLLLLKLKMKALMPILVAIIGLKAMKALILSKVAILLVVGFLVMQLLKKGGMPMAMAMTPAPEPTPPSTAYGPSAPAASAAPSDSYSPHWEPSNNGPYARVWDSAQNSAYSAYYPGNSASSSGSSSSYSSPSSSSVSITSASGTTTY